MENKSNDSTLIIALKQMIKYCQEIRELLKNDKDYFTKNKLSNLEESNKKKIELIDELNFLADDISISRLQDQTGGFLQKIENDATNLDPQAKSELMATINELKAEISECYKFIVSNSNIVFANIQVLKDIWDKLLSCKTGIDYIYDHTGTTVKYNP